MQAQGIGGSLAVITFTNAVLLTGLFALDWSPVTIAFLFWFDAAVVGAVTFIMVTASIPRAGPGSGGNITYVRMPHPGGRARASSSVPRVGGFVAPPLFIVFYGVLLAVYAALLLSSLHEPNYWVLIGNALSLDSVRLSMVLIVGEHLWAFWRDYICGPPWQRADPTFHFWKPFGLAALTWLAYALGFGALGWLHSPLVVLTILIVLKALAEVFGVLIGAQTGEWQRADAAS